MYGQIAHAVRKMMHTGVAKQLGQAGLEEGLKKTGEALIEANTASKAAGKGNLLIRGAKVVLSNGPKSRVRRAAKEMREG